jgi:hypothetical protein
VKEVQTFAQWRFFANNPRIVYKYLRCLDCKLWDELTECFAEDAVTSYAGGQYSFQGRERIVEFLKEALPPTMVTMHQCFQVSEGWFV